METWGYRFNDKEKCLRAPMLRAITVARRLRKGHVYTRFTGFGKNCDKSMLSARSNQSHSGYWGCQLKDSDVTLDRRWAQGVLLAAGE